MGKPKKYFPPPILASYFSDACVRGREGMKNSLEQGSFFLYFRVFLKNIKASKISHGFGFNF